MKTPSVVPIGRTTALSLAAAVLIAAPVARAVPQRVIPLVSEHGAGQFHPIQKVGSPAITLITEHSAGQNHAAQQSTASRSPEQASPDQAAGFDWGDASIGAAGALGLLALGSSVVFVRTRRREHATP